MRCSQLNSLIAWSRKIENKFGLQEGAIEEINGGVDLSIRCKTVDIARQLEGHLTDHHIQWLASNSANVVIPPYARDSFTSFIREKEENRFQFHY